MFNSSSNSTNSLTMDSILLRVHEVKLLSSIKEHIENLFNVKIFSPSTDQDSKTRNNDQLFVMIYGSPNDILSTKNHIMEFLAGKTNSSIPDSTTDVNKTSNTQQILVITLSDSEDDSVPVVKVTPKRRRVKKRKLQQTTRTADLNTTVDLTSPISARNITTFSNTTKDEMPEPKRPCKRRFIIESEPLSARNMNTSNERTEEVLPESNASSRRKFIIESEFIPLVQKNNCLKKKNQQSEITKEKEVPVPLPIKTNRSLRPIVIDGSNVARAHGFLDKTFSCKGIKIAVDFFLQRGHTQVTAFIPLSRKYYMFGPFKNKDQSVLEELEKSGHLVFTPSRKVNGKRLTCYDDRFIVELASKNNGIIVSNDNYKDLIEFSEDFKKTIEERLLMYCFVGDFFMVPNDPLGRNGPVLDVFLSLPAPESHTQEATGSTIEIN